MGVLPKYYTFDVISIDKNIYFKKYMSLFIKKLVIPALALFPEYLQPCVDVNPDLEMLVSFALIAKIVKKKKISKTLSTFLIKTCFTCIAFF